MKLTDEIVRALHGCIEDGFESVADFAREANVSANTISKYMRKESVSIPKATWEKLQPLLRGYMPRGKNVNSSKHGYELDADQKILLDAFNELPLDVRTQKLLEIVELAKKHVRQQNEAKDQQQ